MQLKKISAFVLTFSFLFSSISPLQAAQFQDIATSDWFYPFTEQLANASIISTTNTNFYPYRSITRAELAKMAVNTAIAQNVITIATATQPTFCDVPMSDWAFNFIHTLATANVIQGQPASCAQGRNFFPNNPVSRAEALKILLGLYHINGSNRSTVFTDVDSTSWYAPFVAKALQIQLIDGSNAQFRPYANLSRAEMSKLIVRLSDYAAHNLDNVTALSGNTVNTSTTNTSSTTLSADCRPENCIGVDWHVRAKALDIPEYEHHIANDGKLILTSEQFKVILPDNSANAEDFGRIMLYQLRLAYTGVRRTLGFSPYALPNTIVEEFDLNHATTGSCCGEEKDGYPTVWNAGTRQQYLEKIRLEGPETGYLQTAVWDNIVGDHELTHRFNWTLGLSSFLDEGLAQYVQDRGLQQPIECQQGGYKLNSDFINYDYLDDTFGFYHSGDCFWQRIEKLYGSDMIKRIEARFRRKSERDALQTRIDEHGSPWATWTSFSGQILLDLQQAFIPEIGDRFWTDFQDFCFSPTMAEGKTFQNEKSMKCSAHG